MDNQQNCVTIVNNVIAKIKEISQKVSSDKNSENDNIDVLGNAVETLMSNHQAELEGKGTENVGLNNEINNLKQKLGDQTKRADECAKDLNELNKANLAAQEELEKKMEEMRNEAQAAVTEKNAALIAAKKASENATKANAEATKASEQAKINKDKAESDAAEKEAALKQSSLSAEQKIAAEEEANKARANAIKADSDAKAAIEAAAAAATAAAKTAADEYSASLDNLKATIKSLKGQINNAEKLNTLKNEQIRAQNIELSSKDSELFKMKEKNLELMKQYYGKHLAFKEIFTELNEKIKNNTKKVEGEGEGEVEEEVEEEGKVNSLKTIIEFESITNKITDKIKSKQDAVDVKYSNDLLQKIKSIKERINNINSENRKQSENEISNNKGTSGGDGQDINNIKIEQIKDLDLDELNALLNKFNDIENLLKPDQSDKSDESDQSDQSAQRENLNELTKQHWNSKDDYDDITTFANTLIKMYNDSVGNLNVSIAENKTLNERIEDLTKNGQAKDTEQSQLIDKLTAQLEDLKLEIKFLNEKIESGEQEFQAILDLLTNSNNDASTNFNDTTELIFEENVDVDGLPIIKDNYKIDDKQKTLLELLKNENTNLKSEKDKILDLNKEFPLPFQEQTKPIKIAIYDKLLDLNSNQRRMMRLAILSKEQQEDLKSIDNFKGNIPTLLVKLKDYDPNNYMTIPTIKGEDYNGIMEQIYKSLLANNEELYTSKGQDITILSDVKEEDGVLIKLYKEKLNLENILDMIRIKFTGDYKKDIQIGDNRPGLEEQVKEVAAKNINYSYNGYNSDAASIAAAEKSNDANKKIPVEDFFKDMITKLEANTEEMEVMKTKVENFLKGKTKKDKEKESELEGKISKLEGKTKTNETYLEKLKTLQMNFMKFKKYIDSTNLNLTNLLKNKIDAIHRGEDAKVIFPIDQHRLLIKYDTKTEPEAIDSQIAKMATGIIRNLLTSNYGTQYIENEGGGENTSDTNSTSLVIDDLSNLSQSISDGGYSKNKIKMNSISHKKRKRSIKKYK